MTLFALAALWLTIVKGQTLDEAFHNPPQEARPLIIWQWMDGVVTAEGITADLKAYAKAGLGGVQQFHVGGPLQGTIRDTTNAIGTDKWKQLMRHAISECQRLGLSFGTHNCPGWSSSAYPTVPPAYSMQKLVWSSLHLPVVKTRKKTKALPLPEQPDVDPRWNYYEDIAVVVMPDDSIVSLADIHIYNVKEYPLSIAEKDWHEQGMLVLRFGHTTNGKTNEATAPYGGVGLECDKMSRKAVRHYWTGYPQMLTNLAPDAMGTTFQRIEIDSYEAGGQEWTRLMPQEFKQRMGYDILPWLPVLAGMTVESKQRSKQFLADYAKAGQQLFAENYYGYMAELAHENGLKLLYQPYGTGGAKPFSPINTEAIARLLPSDYFCTEFWTKPNWGWPSVPRHTQTAHRLGLQRIFAEGFTCWPLAAWQEDPASQKALADRAFCLGVNSLMLHAGAQNPWPQAMPGMTFGKWGSWWTPGQTWWRSGAARLLFQYFARCQALLQRGQWIDDFKSKRHSLTFSIEDGNTNALQWTHRKDNQATPSGQPDADIYFVANTLDSAFHATISIDATGREPEIWLPETGERQQAKAWRMDDSKTQIDLHFDEHQSLFIVLRSPTPQRQWAEASAIIPSTTTLLPIEGAWTLRFPSGWDAPDTITLDSLTSWSEHADAGVRYFSGTATYEKTVNISKKQWAKIKKSNAVTLDLGSVKNLAQVSINGHEVAHIWKKPFRCDITPYLKKGDNTLQISVTNLWPNRMIGDEQYEDDVEWDEPFVYEYAPGKPVAGRFMKRIPQWLQHGQPRPSQHRKAIVSFKFFKKDAPLLPSGLLGPVTLQIHSQTP